jgi:hypothetical protein
MNGSASAAVHAVVIGPVVPIAASATAAMANATNTVRQIR